MTERPEHSHDAADESSFAYVRIQVGSDGDAYYTAVYRNGESGPRSEGYRGHSEAEALTAASNAAARDFPGLAQRVEVDTEGDE